VRARGVVLLIWVSLAKRLAARLAGRRQQ
jgi:hypothetical protein